MLTYFVVRDRRGGTTIFHADCLHNGQIERSSGRLAGPVAGFCWACHALGIFVPGQRRPPL